MNSSILVVVVGGGFDDLRNWQAIGCTQARALPGHLFDETLDRAHV